MSLLDKLDLESIRRSLLADIPTPVDVLNLLHFKDEESYKWYGVSVMPLLRAVGGQVGWIGKHVESFLGEPRAEELVVVRYPNQRRFFALALNPYYLLVANPQRLKGVRKFEASFTHSRDSLEPLRRCPWVLAIHFHEAPEAIVSIVEQAGGRLVYQSEETSPISIAKRPHPANTNPLVFKRTALFHFDDRDACQAAMGGGVLNQLQEAAGEVSVQLYQRVRKRDALPASVAGLLG
ncbi:MAG: hypothetical protein WBN70_05605 [Polyangiales bacterium]